MNHKLYVYTIFLYHLISYIKGTDNIQNRSNWWKEVNNNTAEYVPSGFVRSLINSTISGNQYWHTNNNGQHLSSNHSEIYNEIVQPESIVVVPGKNGNTKIIRKIKRTFKNKTVKQNNEQPIEETINEWKENIVEPSITLDQNLPTYTTTISPIINLSKASTTNQLQTTAATDLDNLITSKVKWDDDNDLPLRSPIFKTKINNQENIYEKFAILMPLPPPNQQTTNLPIENQINSNENSNNQQSSSHHSVVAPLSSANNNNYFNFNSKIVHTLPASRNLDGNNKNKRKKQNKQARNIAKLKPLQDFIMETEKIDKKIIDDNHVSPKKTVDFTSRINHEVSPKNNILAHLLKNNPLAIPLGKKTYKITKKAEAPTTLTKRMQTPAIYANTRSKVNDDFTTTPMSTLSNDNLDNINFKATPSKQDYTWGMRRQVSNLISKTNKANQLAKRNEWSGNDEQKDLNDKLHETNNESDEESVENDENTNSEDTELINKNSDDELNNEFNKNLEAIKNEEAPKFDFVTFKSKNKGNEIVKNNLNNVKSLPIQIISWRQAINHGRKKNLNDNEPKQFAGERLTSAKLTVSNRAIRKEQQQQIEREKPAPRVLNKQTTKPFSSTSTTKANNGNTFKTTTPPKLPTTTKSNYQNTVTTNTQQTTTKRSQVNINSTPVRNPLNSFVANRKNEPYVAPPSNPQTPITKTKTAQLFQEYEDEKESFKEELEDNFINRQVDHSSPKKENRVKYAKNQEFRKKSLNLVEEKNDNSIDNDQTEATKAIPATSFKCQSPGYYADLETGCEVFHICQENNRKDSFFCPPGTVFNEMLSVCDWRHNVNCDSSNRRSNPSSTFNSNNAFESLNNLRNNHEVEDSLEDQKK